jgi:hypothetical protein
MTRETGAAPAMIVTLFGGLALAMLVAELIIDRVLRAARAERDRAARLNATISEIDRRLAVMRGRAFGRMKGKDDE